MPTSIEEFFHRYAARSLGSEPESLAPLYAPTFIVAGPQGSMAFTNDAQFVTWLKQVHDFNEAHGMRSLRTVAVHELALSPVHTLATVRWGAQFDKTGDRLIEFEISYFLEGARPDYRRALPSPAFDALPPGAKDPIYRRMWEVLSGRERDPRYRAVLSLDDRRAIVEILRDTKKDLPSYFKTVTG